MNHLSTLINRALAASNVPVEIHIESGTHEFVASLRNADDHEPITMRSDWERPYTASASTVLDALNELNRLAAEDLAATDSMAYRIACHAQYMKDRGCNWPSMREFLMLYGDDPTPADCADYLCSFDPTITPRMEVGNG